MSEEPERIESRRGRGIVVRGNDIDTDQIVPARFLAAVTFEGLEEAVFRDVRTSTDGVEKDHPFNDRQFAGAQILVVNKNFGCGSSREHAPQALARWGIRAIVGESFGEIFFGNCVALGLPCVTLGATDITRLQASVDNDPSLEVTVDVEGARVLAGVEEFAAGIPEGVQQAFLSGAWDSTGALLDKPEEVEEVAKALPYVTVWGGGRG